MAFKFDPNQIPGLRIFTEDENVNALQDAMTQSAQALNKYRSDTAAARDQSTRNQLAAFEPSNRLLTKLMGGEQQFDLGGFQSPYNPEMFNNTPIQQEPWVEPSQRGLPAAGEISPEERADIAVRSAAGRGSDFQHLVQQEMYNPFTSPLGPIPFLFVPGVSEAMDANYYGDKHGQQALDAAALEGYEPGVTVKPAWWDQYASISWPNEGLYTPRWENLNPQQKAMAIERGEAHLYEGVPADAGFTPQLSDEELARLTGG